MELLDRYVSECDVRAHGSPTTAHAGSDLDFLRR